MGFNLSDGWTLCWIELQNIDDEALEFLAEVAAELVVPQSYFFPHFFYTLRWKWSEPMKKFIEQYSKCPHIYAVIVLLLKHHFRRHVLIRPAEGFPLHLDVISGPTEIANFDIEGMIQQYVLRLYKGRFYLEIAMHDVLRMHVPHS